MKIARSASELRTVLLGPPRPVGFVPTMGAWHDGHLSLIRGCRERCATTVVSIFVNPLQFGPTEDYAAYPRDEDRDLALARAAGVDIAFLPAVDEMYPPGASTTVSVGRLATILEGASRPGHFDGVATVVAKLFNLVDPDVAYFGQKDAQQVAVIKKMVADLDFRTEIAVGPTVRDPDGLALSSRNAYLSPDERRTATTLYRALQEGRATLDAGDDPSTVEKWIAASFDRVEGVELDYAAAVDPDTFEAPREGGPVLLAVAARVGKTRLIDNVLVDPRT